jgi:two-component system phosphate regulon sensor histidine kinase PhoR
VPDALVVLNKTSRIEWANPAAATLMGVLWPAHEGQPLTAVFEQQGLAEYLDRGDYPPAGGGAGAQPVIMLSIRVAPFGERKRQRLVVGRDITKIFHLNMIRRDFVANASHELRTPLTVIAGFVENLAGSALTPEPHRRPLR